MGWCVQRNPASVGGPYAAQCPSLANVAARRPLRFPAPTLTRCTSPSSSMLHSLYLHIPFCRHRCAYCDFNTYAGQEGVIPAYVDALCKEIRIAGGDRDGQLSRIKVHTVFFGGGTPSLLTPAQFNSILSAIRANFELQ